MGCPGQPGHDNMTRHGGYHTGFVRAVQSADLSSVGVQLGRICTKRNIPVMDVAEYLGVSRQAVYQWFTGKAKPHPRTAERIRELVKRLKEKQREENQ